MNLGMTCSVDTLPSSMSLAIDMYAASNTSSSQADEQQDLALHVSVYVAEQHSVALFKFAGVAITASWAHGRFW